MKVLSFKNQNLQNQNLFLMMKNQSIILNKRMRIKENSKIKNLKILKNKQKSFEIKIIIKRKKI